ncbi:MAG: NAD(P)(+) transhydrogenase (Re/Si-specific) subunit beta [Sandaracinaceae bacterium]
MQDGVLTIAYLVAGVFFIRSLGGLSRQETARRGNMFGIVGMALALVATAFHPRVASYPIMAGCLAVGAVIGAVVARRVAMTAMPELVAILHSFVGLAAVLVGISSHLDPAQQLHGIEASIHAVEIWIGIAVGAVTFTGSVIAWGKLRGTITGKPLLLPARHLLNAVVAIAIVGLAVPFMQDPEGPMSFTYMLVMTGLASALGVHLVMAIGGADMPVVVSLLNSYSGWAAAAAGFVLENDLLIVTGALVGSSGAILSIIMCRAMNRSILNVVFGGFGTADSSPGTVDTRGKDDVHETSADEVAGWLKAAKEVIIVPGYGMAVARAQNAVYDLTKSLRKAGVNVRFAIHPVAGRLPGHMNVLLAEAGVPYDIVQEMDDINADFDRTQVVLVIGANDIVNPSALDDTSSPIYGMPVLEAWNAERVVVFKRSMGSGYAGVQNPLFFLDNAYMLFGDADKTMRDLCAAAR